MFSPSISFFFLYQPLLRQQYFVWQSNLAFGPKGRPASAGKPRIPGDAVVTFDVEMVGLPGKEPELIELIGDA